MKRWSMRRALPPATLLVAAVFAVASGGALVAQAQSSCTGVTYVNGTSTGTVTDGSGLERYKGQGNCTWLIEPESNPDGTIFVAIDEFRTVMGADSLYFLDGTDSTFLNPNNVAIYGNPLAVLTGIIPTPHVMRFDADDLRVQFISQGSDIREEGFSFRWWTDGSTCAELDDCNGNGECAGGLCECEKGFAGGDCSIAVPDLPTDGSVVSGELAIGATDYYTITIPDDGEKYFLRVDMRSLGGVDADPMLMIANATASPNWMSDYYFTPPQGSESVGPCGPEPGCHWCVYPTCDPGYDDPQISPLMTIAGPVTDYAHTSFGVDDAYPDPVNTRLMSLPSQQFHTFNDYESWDLKKPLHTIFLSNEASDKTELAPGEYVIGVTNSLPTKLVDLGEERFWGTDPGFSGATASAPYELSAVLSTDLNDTCPLGCSGNGECFANECVCDVTDTTHYAGSACEIPVAVIPPDLSFQVEPLPAGEWAYFFVPLDSADLAKRFFAEIAFPGSPDSLPFLFVSRESNGVPEEIVECGNYWGSGPYGATHCEIVGFKSEAEAIDNPLATSGVDYHYVVLEPESNVISDGQIEDGFYVGVYNHPGHGDASLDYQLSTRFVDVDSDSTCPFGCSGNGQCLPPFDPTSPIGICDCDDGFAGAYCNDVPVKISVGDKVEDELASGDWAYYEFQPESSGQALVSLSKETENIAKPLLFIKEGRFPSLTSVYSSNISSFSVDLDPRFNGVSIDQYTSSSSPGYVDNIFLDLGAIPEGALITGIAFENLTVSTVGSSYVNELCLVFFTDDTSFSSPVCLRPDFVAPAPEGGLVLDGQGPAIFEAIRAPASGFRVEIGEDPAANDNVEAPDAFLNGTLIIQYVEELASGFDYEDSASIFCNGIDCAVDDFHDIVLQAEAGKKYFIGILNARHITGSSHVDSVAMGGTQERFRETLEYSLDIKYDADAVPCYQDCNGAGECLEELAPICSCEDGFFGIACEIVPEQLPVGTSLESAEAVEGDVPQGRFDYYTFELPEDATSLVLTMTSPRGIEDSVPALFVKRGGLPRKCDSIQGVALSNCVDDYDFATSTLSRTLSDADTRVYQLVITPATNTTLTNEVFDGAGGTWYASVHSDLVGFDDLTYTLEAFQTSDIQCQVLDCSNNGICDTSVGLCKCVERDGLDFGRDDCSAPIFEATEGETLTIPEAIPPGQVAFINVEINCEGQDLVMTASRPISNAGAEFEIVVPQAPGLEPDFDVPLYVSWESMREPDNYRGYYAYFPSNSGAPGTVDFGAATVNNMPPGVYTIGVFNYFDSTADLVDLEFTYNLRASLSPNGFNQCDQADGRLTLDILSSDGNLIETLLGPSAGTTRDYKGGQGCDLLEANFIGTGEFCGTAEQSCLFASNHTTYPSASFGLVSDVGSGNVAGRFVFGISPATANNADYFYFPGSVNKQSGVAGPDVDGVLYQAIAGEEALDFEGCAPLANPEEMEGNICVLVRGGCTFSQKVINCQRAGATAVVIINSRENDCAITMGGAYVGETFQIPSAMISNRAGVQILQNAIAESDPATYGPTTGIDLSVVNLSGVAGAYNVASCEPTEKCPACGEGRFDLDDEGKCDITCPGVSPSGSFFFGDVFNCTGNGVDDGSGGCTVTPSGATCTCAPGFIGDDCSLPATPDCPSECTACQNCVRSFCFAIDCPFCQDGLLGLGVGYEDGMLNGCDSERCGACIET